jgi:UDPglucose 6-dehydrogenase
VDISIFGTGYVGLVTGACFAESGNRVCCVDIDADKVAALQRGDIPIYEPGLAEMVEQNARDGRLIFTTDAEKGIDHGRVIFIAVNTPSSDDGASDLSSVRAVARTIGNLLSHPAVIVNKSTVPVGTADVVREIIADALAERGVDVTFDVVSNPEFLKEGDAISDFMRPDRIVLGAERSESIEIMRHLYGPFNRNHNRIIVMDIRSSELTKYAANALLATKISFMNEIANIAERVGANVENIRAGIGSDARIGYHFIYAGIGYGGSCFPKDIRALSHTALEAGYEAELINAVESVNERQKQVLLDKILEHFDGSIRGKTFAIWGIAFKPKTDDIREAPSRALIEALWEHGARAQVYDPEAMDNLEALYGERPDLILAGSRDDTVLGADALVICTEWRQFRSPDFAFLREHLQQPVIFDGRNMYDPERIRREGFTYYGVGLGETSTRTALPDTIAEDSLLSVLAND